MEKESSMLGVFMCNYNHMNQFYALSYTESFSLVVNFH